MSSTIIYSIFNDSVNKTIYCGYYHGTILLGVQSVVLTCLAIASLAMNYALLQCLLRCDGHLPLNTKLLLINCTVAAMIKSACFISRSIYNLCLVQFGFNEMVIDRYICIVIEAPYAISTFALLLSMIFIGMERLWSTWKKNLSQIEIVGWQVISAQMLIWIASVIIYVVEMVIVDESTKKKTCYCYFPMMLSGDSNIINNVIVVGTQTLNMIIYFFVYWKNKRLLLEFTLNTARNSLSERFIMWANVKATKMLIPASVVHAFSYDLVLASMYFIRRFSTLSTNDYLSVVVFTNCLLCLDTLLHPILCLRYSEPLKKIAETWYPKVLYLIGRPNKDYDSSEGTMCRCNKETIAFKKHKNPRVKNYRPKGIKSIVEYRVKPEQHQDILNQVWDISGKKSVVNNMSKQTK